MHLANWFLICVTIFLLTKGAAPLNKKWYQIIIHNLTRKVVASDGTLWDKYEDEKWKRWALHPTTAPYYYFKAGTEEYPGEFPWESSFGSPASLVLGSQKVCQPSWGDKVPYKRNTPSQQWKVSDGIKPIYNGCRPRLQLTVKKDGEMDRIYLEKPKLLKGDRNSLFQVVTTDDYRDMVEEE